MPAIMTDAELVRAAITASDVSTKRFAERVVWRDQRTVRRWLAGDSVPKMVIDRLQWFLSLSAKRRSTIVRELAR